MADYGNLGHGEVVGIRIPQSSVGDFAIEYFKLFGTKGERADPMDKGGEYRSLLGLPGGRNHPMFDKVEAVAADQGMKLVDGKGNDPDTLGKRLVYVMDSKKFPFYQAEVCKYCSMSIDDVYTSIFYNIFSDNVSPYEIVHVYIQIINTTMTFCHQPMGKNTMILPRQHSMMDGLRLLGVLIVCENTLYEFCIDNI